VFWLCRGCGEERKPGHLRSNFASDRIPTVDKLNLNNKKMVVSLVEWRIVSSARYQTKSVRLDVNAFFVYQSVAASHAQNAVQLQL
jgi:hypothetical protein